MLSVRQSRTTILIAVIMGCLVPFCLVAAQQYRALLRMDDLMTVGELRDTGVGTLSPTQRKALDIWLNRYTTSMLRASTEPQSKGSCTPAVESTIAGEFEGWSGETIFKLDDGQIWEQAEYSYTYSYAYRPSVTIYQSHGGCRLKVEDEDETILVRRIK